MKVTVSATSGNLLSENTRYRFGSEAQPVSPDLSLFNRVRGYILLQVEEHGEAWYVDHDSQKRYYMKDGPTAYEMLRRFGLGISNANLDRIPIGFDDRIQDNDTDGDGLSDRMEDALGSDAFDSDSDDDGYRDGDEVRAGYSPTNQLPVKIRIDSSLTQQLLGKIVLQVEAHGEAWYVNPHDGRRYYMKNGDSAYQIMRFLSLGISNKDIQLLSVGSL